MAEITKKKTPATKTATAAKPRKAPAKKSANGVEANPVAENHSANGQANGHAHGHAAPHDEVARLAHSFWQERGHKHGQHEEDWYRAEQELRGRA
jgi:hypothetical protein